MSLRTTYLLLLLLICTEVHSRSRGKSKRKAKLHKRFPKPDFWMHYSSNYNPAEELGCIDFRGSQCQVYARKPDYCFYERDFMIRNCRKSCTMCNDGGIGRPNNKGVTGLTQGKDNGESNGHGSVLNGDCEDLLEDCPKYLKTQKHCTLFSRMTKKYCAKTCGYCCSDLLLECPLFIKNPSQCTELNGFFRKYCAQTCKFCGLPQLPVKKAGCADELSECKSFKIEDCRVHEEFGRKYCAKSCGYCATNPLTSKETSTVEMELQQKTEEIETIVINLISTPSSPTTLLSKPEEAATGSTAEEQSTVKSHIKNHSSTKNPKTVTRKPETSAVNHETKKPTEKEKQGTTTTSKRQKDVPDDFPTTKRKLVNSPTRRKNCEDRIKECSMYVEENPNYCKYHVDFMIKYCSKSCKFCEKGKIPKCVDRRKRKCKKFSKFRGYCTVYRKFMASMCPSSCGFCGDSPGLVHGKVDFKKVDRKYEFVIKTVWDGSPINHPPIKIQLSAEDNNNVRLEVSGPFFDKPGKPPCLAGQPCWQLWDYEVAEVFFLGEKEKYFELEVSPHGPHLLLLLDGVRKPFKTKLPMRYSANIDYKTMTWNGTAIVPLDYFPPSMRKINAYAIHGPNNAKVYESLYPAKNTLHPDFHRLEFFQDFDFKSMFPSGWKRPLSPFWVGRI